MNKGTRNLLVAVVLLVVLAGCWFAARGRVHFDWNNLKLQMRTVSWTYVAAAVGLIYVSMALRAPRWRILLGSATNTSSLRLVGPQFVGFAVVGLFGRAADLARPYLIGRRTETPIATQLAVYFIERAMDLGAAATLFALTLAMVPASMPHYEQFKIAGRFALTGVVAIVVFLVAVRVAGNAIAAIARKVFRIISEAFAERSAATILEFRDGLKTITSFGQFSAAAVLSLLCWVAIAGAYFATSRAFVSSPQLANFTVPQTMLLMASSMAGSLVQLPVVGWFSQIAVLALAYSQFFGVPVEVASAAGAVLMLVASLSVVPGGLLAARIEGISLREAARGAETVEAAPHTEA